MSWATLCAQWPCNLVHGEANGHDRGDGLPANAKFGIMMKKTIATVLAAVTLAATLAATSTDASAQWGRRWGPGWGWRGPGVGAGIAAGVIGGAIVAGAILATRPAGYVVYPGYAQPVSAGLLLGVSARDRSGRPRRWLHWAAGAGLSRLRGAAASTAIGGLCGAAPSYTATEVNRI